MIRQAMSHMMESDGVHHALDALECALQQTHLTPQEQFAAIALLAARQMSVFPTPDQIVMADAFRDMVELALKLGI